LRATTTGVRVARMLPFFYARNVRIAQEEWPICPRLAGVDIGNLLTDKTLGVS
jgi:hypothetical protein